MAELDFLMLADHVKVEGGQVSLLGGGFDRVFTTAVPAPHVIGVVARVLFTESECNQRHHVEMAFRQDQQLLAQAGGEVGATPAEDAPPGWPVAALFGFNLQLILPVEGIYQVDLRLDGAVLRTQLFEVRLTPTRPAN